MAQYLVHYGVKGMKWGKRKAQTRSAQEAYKKYQDIQAKQTEFAREKLKQESAYNKRLGTVERSKRVRQETYMDRAKKYVGYAFKRLQKGDFKTAVQHGKSAVQYALKSLLSGFKKKEVTTTGHFTYKGGNRPLYTQPSTTTVWGSGDTSQYNRKDK